MRASLLELSTTFFLRAIGLSLLFLVPTMSYGQQAGSFGQKTGLEAALGSHVDCGQSCALQRINEVSAAEALYVRQKARIVAAALKSSSPTELSRVVTEFLPHFCMEASATRAKESHRECAERYVRVQQIGLYARGRALAENSHQRAKLENLDSSARLTIDPLIVDNNAKGAASSANRAVAKPQLTYVPSARELKDQFEADKLRLRELVVTDYQTALDAVAFEPGAQDFVRVQERVAGGASSPGSPQSRNTVLEIIGLDSALHQDAVKDFVARYGTQKPGARAAWENLKREMSADFVRRYSAGSGSAVSMDFNPRARQTAGAPVAGAGENDSSIRLYQDVRDFIVKNAHQNLSKSGVLIAPRMESSGQSPVVAGAGENGVPARGPANQNGAASGGAAALDAPTQLRVSESPDVLPDELQNPVAPEGSSIGDHSIYLDPTHLLRPIGP